MEDNACLICSTTFQAIHPLQIVCSLECNERVVEVVNKQIRPAPTKRTPSKKYKENSKNRISKAFRARNFSWEPDYLKILGLSSYKEGAQYIEKQFVLDMSWDNYFNVWEIDHTIPLRDATDRESLIKLLHHTNTKPLTKVEHDKKTRAENIARS